VLDQTVNRPSLSLPEISARRGRCIASNGFQADIKKVHEDLPEQAVLYQHRHGKSMSCRAAAGLRHPLLRALLPCCTSTVCAGLDGQGELLAAHPVASLSSQSPDACASTTWSGP